MLEGIITVENLMYVGWFFGMVFGFFCLMIYLRTPAITFLKASMSGKPIIQVPREDKKMDFAIADVKKGTAKLKNYGYYKLNPAGMYKVKGGVTIGTGLSDRWAILTPEFINAAQNIYDKGFSNNDEVEAAIYFAKMKSCNEDIEDAIEKEIVPPVYVQYYAQLMNTGKIDAIVKEIGDKNYINSLVNYNMLKRFMTYDYSPSLAGEIVVTEYTERMEKQKKGLTMETLLKVVVIVGVLLICAGITYLLINSGAVKQVGDLASQAGSGRIIKL